MTAPEGSWHFKTLSADTLVIPDNAISSAGMILAGTITTPKMAQNAYTAFPMSVLNARVWDSGALLPASAGGADDLYLSVGTWGTDSPVLKSDDANGDTVLQYALFSCFMPDNYDDDADVKIRVPAKLGVDGDGAKTVDLVVYEGNKNGGIGSDICADAAQTMTTSWANYDFDITDDDLVSGDELWIRLAVNIVDSGSGAGIIANIGSPTLMCDTRG